MKSKKNKERSQHRFSLWFDTESEEFFVMRDIGVIYMGIFKKDGKYQDCLGLWANNGNDNKMTYNGIERNIGQPERFSWLADFKDWRSKSKIGCAKGDKEYQLSNEDFVALKKAVQEVDRRIKF